MRSVRQGSPFTTAIGLALVAGLLAASCSGTSGTQQGDQQVRRGGDLIIARTAESLGMDKTAVFDNESIWIFVQLFEMLYEVAPDGKEVVPWLATSYDLSPDKLTWTFHLRPGVQFHNGQPMTAADVKFSIDEARTTKGGWEFLDSAIKDIEAPDDATVEITTKYPWSPLLADIALFSNGIIPQDYAGMSKEDFYQNPIGTGPFQWDHWTKGQEIQLVKNPTYWQKGKPYLDSVTWTLVPDDNTRILQLKGGQAHIDEFPPWSAVDSLQKTPGVVMGLFPSTRTDYMLFNHRVKPLDDVHVRRAISYAIDRQAMVDAVLFGNGEPAKSFMPPQVPFYDPNSPGLQYDPDKAKEEMAASTVPDGFDVTLQIGSGVVTENSLAQIVQQELDPLGIDVTLKKVDPSTEFTNIQEFEYELGFSYWTMDIADPDELVTFAVDPGAGSHSFFTDYRNDDVIDWTHQAEAEFDEAKRQELYSNIQRQAAEDAFMVFLFHSPYAYAYSDRVHGFKVYPTGNYHLENTWLST